MCGSTLDHERACQLVQFIQFGCGSLNIAELIALCNTAVMLLLWHRLSKFNSIELVFRLLNANHPIEIGNTILLMGKQVQEQPVNWSHCVLVLCMETKWL